MTRPWRWAGIVVGGLLALPSLAQQPGPATSATSATTATARATSSPSQSQAAPATRSGREIYERFRTGLADPDCVTGDSSPRWRQHFAAAPQRLAAGSDDLLPLFGYVVDALREASLPTEYALIPFVESGYKPGARSASGPAGLWQMIALTARNHGVPIRPGYDGRLSPVDSTRAAVRYLKTLHGMFAGDWRLAVMAYNAGEYRIFGALKRSGQMARSATPEQLPGLNDITHAYVRKLHALSCLMEDADNREGWLRSLDRPVPRLAAIDVPDEVADIAGWAASSGQDAAQLQRLNPAFGNGRITRQPGKRASLLAVPAPLAAALLPAQVPASAPAAATNQNAPGQSAAMAALSPPQTPAAGEQAARRHTVARGDNLWTIARRYEVRTTDLLQINQLSAHSVLKPGHVVLIDAAAPAAPLPGQ